MDLMLVLFVTELVLIIGLKWMLLASVEVFGYFGVRRLV